MFERIDPIGLAPDLRVTTGGASVDGASLPIVVWCVALAGLACEWWVGRVFGLTFGFGVCVGADGVLVVGGGVTAGVWSTVGAAGAGGALAAGSGAGVVSVGGGGGGATGVVSVVVVGVVSVVVVSVVVVSVVVVGSVDVVVVSVVVVSVVVVSVVVVSVAVVSVAVVSATVESVVVRSATVVPTASGTVVGSDELSAVAPLTSTPAPSTRPITRTVAPVPMKRRRRAGGSRRMRAPASG